ncbi:MAG: O-antigen ligase [Hyphomonas sp.]|nr:O-antigen ligase family protein [Hyphomonas sp.]MCB9971476.1 O-antigen ligase family protein [Hyphomonas sp.]
MNAPAKPANDPTPGQFWARAEVALVLVCLVFFSEGFIPRLVSPEKSPDGNPFLRQLWLPIYACALMLGALNWQNMLRIAFRSPFLLLLTAMTVVSSLWSIDPAITFRRSIALVCMTVFGMYLAARFTWPEVLRLLGWTWLFLCAANLIAGGLFPGFGVDHEIHVGAWIGFYWEKNALGGYMSRAAFLFLFLAIADKRHRKAWIAGAVLSVLLVLLSTSKTALLAMFVGFAALMAGIVMKRGAGMAIGTFWIAAVGAISAVLAVLLAPNVVFGLLGKDPSLTGRTDIWEALMRSVSQHPFLGYGYGAFWGEHSAPAHWVRLAVHWEAPTAHNGWLEVLLAIGFVGLGLFLLNFFVVVVRSVISSAYGWGGIFAVGFLVQFLLFSLTESVVLQQNAIVWLSYIVVAGRLAMDAYVRSTAHVRPAGPSLGRRPPKPRRTIEA